MRSPRRTAQTASALMVGLALVSAIAVFGASLSRSATSSVDNAISADLIVSTTSNNGHGRLQHDGARRRRRRPGRHRRRRPSTGTSSRSGARSRTSLRSRTQHLVRDRHPEHDGGHRSRRWPPAICSSTPRRPTPTTWRSGDTVPVKFAKTGTTTMRIGGIFQANALIGKYLVGDAFFLAHFQNPLPDRRAAQDRRQPGRGAERRPRRWRAYPNVKVQTRAQFEAVAVGPGQPAARPGLRAAGPGRAHRPHRDRQHADAVGVRAHARDRAAACRRHEAPPDPGHDPLRVGDPGRVRRRHRHHRRDGTGHRAGLGRSSRRASPTPWCRSRASWSSWSWPRCSACSRPAGRPGAPPSSMCWPPSRPTDAAQWLMRHLMATRSNGWSATTETILRSSGSRSSSVPWRDARVDLHVEDVTPARPGDGVGHAQALVGARDVHHGAADRALYRPVCGHGQRWPLAAAAGAGVTGSV